MGHYLLNHIWYKLVVDFFQENLYESVIQSLNKIDREVEYGATSFWFTTSTVVVVACIGTIEPMFIRFVNQSRLSPFFRHYT